MNDQEGLLGHHHYECWPDQPEQLMPHLQDLSEPVAQATQQLLVRSGEVGAARGAWGANYISRLENNYMDWMDCPPV